MQSFSNLFVEFLLKEASQGQPLPSSSKQPESTLSPTPSTRDILSLNSPPATSGSTTPYDRSGESSTPPGSRPRGMSTSSSASTSYNTPQKERPPIIGLPSGGRKGSQGLQQIMDRPNT